MRLLKLTLFGLIAFHFAPAYALETAGAAAKISPAVGAEIHALKSEASLSAQQKLIHAIVSKVGPEAAQKALHQSGLPFTGDTHLIIHTIGHIIYQQYGPAGIEHCLPYFLGACYHGFLLDAIGGHGPDAITALWARCKDDGTSIASQCAHGIGHGLLAWHSYSVPKAISDCDSVAARIEGFAASNCYDGVFMENAWKLHACHGEPDPGQEALGDLSAPCNDSKLRPEQSAACWGNQVTVLYRAFKGDLLRIANTCNSLESLNNQEACFGGLARQIHPLTGGNADEAARLCASATSGHWQRDCLVTIAEAAFSVGDHTTAPFQICHRMDEATRPDCYRHLFGLIAAEARGDRSRAYGICAHITESADRSACLAFQDKSLEGKEESAGPKPGFGPVPASDAPSTAPWSVAQYPTPYMTPYLTPYMSPYSTPYLTPYMTPYTPPYPIPYITPR